MSEQHYGFRFFPSSQSGELDLPLLDWEGGPAYWEQFAKADAGGWSDPSFFPICVFLASTSPTVVQAYKDANINTYMTANHDPPISNVTDEGIFVIPNYTVTAPDGEVDNGWSIAEIGNDPLCVGWFIYDEAEQGEGVYWDLDVVGGGSGSTEFERLAFFQSETQAMRDLNDGRFMFANFGNGVLHHITAALNTMDEFVQTVDACCIDKYAYTSTHVQGQISDSDDWPGSPAPATRCSAAYGWFASQLRNVFDDPNNRRPLWVFIEVKKPLISDVDASIISHEEREGAIFSAIANEARGIAYFDHNGFYPPNTPAIDPNTGSAPTTESWTIPDGPATYATAVTDCNARILALAPVLNTQTYVFDFDATGIKTMLKAKDGFAYIFASVDIDGALGSKTFTLTGSGITGTDVEVVDEARSLTVSGGQFTDSFPDEYTHHIYKVEI